MISQAYTVWVGFLLSVLLSACLAPGAGYPDFLSGIWKTEGSESYEVWEKESDSRYVGYAYKIQDGKKKVWELDGDVKKIGCLAISCKSAGSK